MKIVLNIMVLSLLMVACNGTQSDASVETTPEEKGSGLPYFGQHSYEMTTKDGQQVMDTIYHVVPPYYFTAHDSSEFVNDRVEGKVHVANFFFTSCPAICPAMIAQMKRLQENTTDIDELVFLSHTIDPRRDTIPRLQEYIAQKNLDTRNWHFLYNEDKAYIHDLGETGYMINAMEDEAAEGGFLHSEHFILIDREGHIRGLYDGTNTERVDQLETDIRKLLATEYGE